MEEGPGSNTNSLNTLTASLNDQLKVANFVKSFYQCAVTLFKVSTHVDINEVQDQFADEAIRELDAQDVPKAFKIWNQLLEDNGFKPDAPLTSPAPTQSISQTLVAPTAEWKASTNPEQAPEPEPAQVLAQEQAPAVAIGFQRSLEESGAEMGFSGPPKRKPAPQEEADIEIINSPDAPAQLTLTQEQLAEYKQLCGTPTSDGEVFAQTLQQAASNPKKGQSKLDAMVDASLVLAVAARQEVQEFKKGDVNQEQADQLKVLSNRQQMAEKTYRHLQEIQALKSANTRLSDEVIKEKVHTAFESIPAEQGAKPLQEALVDLTKQHGKAKRELTEEGVTHESRFKNRRSYTAKVTQGSDGKKQVDGKVFFSNKDLIHPSSLVGRDLVKKSAKAYEDMKARAHDFITVGIAQADMGSKENPIDLYSKPPPSNELLVQAVIDLKERAVLEGREFHMIDKEGKPFVMGPNPQLNDNEKAYFNSLAKEKSYTLENGVKHESTNTAGVNVLRHCVKDFDAKKDPASVWQEHLKASMLEQQKGFEQKADSTLKGEEPEKKSKAKPKK